jgi:hypothetical protein
VPYHCTVWAADFETPVVSSPLFFFFGSISRNKQYIKLTPLGFKVYHPYSIVRLVDFCRPAAVLNLKQPAEILPPKKIKGLQEKINHFKIKT